MSYTLHVCCKHQVEFADVEFVDHKVHEFHNLLYVLDFIEMYIGEPTSFGIPKEDWIAGIEKMKGYQDLPRDEKSEIRKSVKALGLTVPETIKMFESLYKNSDPKEDWIYFEFF